MVAGADLLEYRAEILEITREMINKCMSRRGYTWAGKFLRYTLVSLTEVYPLECRSVDPETWKNPGKSADWLFAKAQTSNIITDLNRKPSQKCQSEWSLRYWLKDFRPIMCTNFNI